MNGESSMETYTLPDVEQYQWAFAVPVWPRELCDNLEGWGGGLGREVQEEGNMCLLMADSHCTAQTNTL